MKDFKFYRHLMSGVSQMIPFVVAGGIMIALAFLFDVNNAGAGDYGSGNTIAAWFMNVGGTAFGFMLPILAGFIAYSIADRPGFVPGFIGGALAMDQSGFLGAILIGFLAGGVIVLLKKLTSGFPRSLNGIKPVLIFPLVGTIIVALLMTPINLGLEPFNIWLADAVQGMEGTSALLLGIIAGGMMAVDMGGPINKAAYIAAVGTIAGGVSTILMAVVIVGGMVPPLGIALATVLFKGKFTEQQREAGKTNWVMGFSFITEGAIPFAAAKPHLVIPSIIAGSALAGAIVGIFGVASPAPHGGIFIVPLMANWGFFLVALAAGTVLTAFLLKVLLPDAEEDMELETE